MNEYLYFNKMASMKSNPIMIINILLRHHQPDDQTHIDNCTDSVQICFSFLAAVCASEPHNLYGLRSLLLIRSRK